MTATLAKITSRALSQVGGYFPGNSPYGVWYDATYAGNKGTYDAAQFCAMGLSWVFAQEGALDIFPAHAYTPSGVNAWKARGLWHDGTKGIQPGDVLYFDFPGAPDRVSHVGLALSSWKNGVDTVEFNTSGTAAGNQRNGRVVARKRRTTSIVGYGRPAYGSNQPTSDVGGNFTDRPTTEIQALVGADTDGAYGPDTTAKVKVWQSANGLTPDGNWGPLSDAKGFPPVGGSAGKKRPIILEAMMEGSTTSNDARWQRVLYEMGFRSVGAADGDFGSKTKQATRNFQAARGLAVDGVAGPDTVSASLLTDGDSQLRQGDQGARVELLQVIVGTTPDRSFGPNTRRETQEVQRYFGVEPDGVVGPVFVREYRKEAK